MRKAAHGMGETDHPMGRAAHDMGKADHVMGTAAHDMGTTDGVMGKAAHAVGRHPAKKRANVAIDVDRSTPIRGSAKRGEPARTAPPDAAKAAR